MLSIISWNVNGLRSVIGKGLPAFLQEKSPDVVCIQEIKCDDIPLITAFAKEHSYCFAANPAKKKGYSGTLTLWKNTLDIEIISEPDIGIDEDFLAEGRIVETVIRGVRLLNLYIPSGSSSEERQIRKFHFMEQFRSYLEGLSDAERGTIIMCGDFNICHQEIDIHHPKEATKKMLSGFLPEEREWFTDILSLGFKDVFREVNPDEKTYSWWSYRAGARGKNLGWRLDYFLCGIEAFSKVSDIQIMTSVLGSDHCPVQIKLDI